jgi:hypothetical protein
MTSKNKKDRGNELGISVVEPHSFKEFFYKRLKSKLQLMGKN